MAWSSAKRAAAVVVLTAMALVATGCSSTPALPTGASTSTTGKPLALNADQVVWQVASTGGLTTPVGRLTALPAITIYGDGRVFVPDPAGLTSPTQSLRVRVGSINPNALADFLRRALAAPAFAPGATFGQPTATSQPTTSVRLHTGGVARAVSVVGLSAQPTAGPDASQARRRAELVGLIGQSTQLATSTSPWQPDQVVAYDLERTPVGATTVPVSLPQRRGETSWQGPDFSTFLHPSPDLRGTVAVACGVVTGDYARRVARTGLDHPDDRWTDSAGNTLSLVLRVVLPSEVVCRS